MSLAICINCGYAKQSPIAKCKNCGFQPKTDEEKAKSLILSLNYEIDGVYKGQSKERLLEIGELIKRHQYHFDDAEVRQVIEYAKAVLSVPASRLVKDLIKWLFWPFVIILIMLFAIFRAH
jgi:hypothetical protein